MPDIQEEKPVMLLQPPTPISTDAADGSVSATKDVAKLSYQGQPRRLSARKSKSVYRHLVDLETPQHDGENIQHANATSASTFHVPTKVRKKTVTGEGDKHPKQSSLACLSGGAQRQRALTQRVGQGSWSWREG